MNFCKISPILVFYPFFPQNFAKNFWLWKIGFFDKKLFFWNMCKFVGNRQNKKKIAKIKSLREIHANPYPKWYHNANSLGTMLVWILIMFSNP